LLRNIINMYGVDYTTFFDIASGSSTMGHCWKLKTTNSRLNSGANFFIVKVTGDWNSQPEHVVNATSFNHFKGSLDLYVKMNTAPDRRPPDSNGLWLIQFQWDPLYGAVF